jgi:predicted Rossmann-fold nucleotide-binding protein
LDELFEAFTLMQTGKMEPFPIILMGAQYWREVIFFIEKLARLGTIGPRDPGLIHVTDSIEEALVYLRRHAIEPFGLRSDAHQPWRRFSRRNGHRTVPRPFAPEHATAI